jgi:hypothetical protein
MTITDAAEPLDNLERMVAAVKGEAPSDSKFARALATLQELSRKEGIAMAIVGGLAAIHHGYQRFTKDIDVVVQSSHLDVLTRVAPPPIRDKSHLERPRRVAQVAARRRPD